MKKANLRELLKKKQQLRINSTEAESLLWKRLKINNLMEENSGDSTALVVSSWIFIVRRRCCVLNWMDNIILRQTVDSEILKKLAF